MGPTSEAGSTGFRLRWAIWQSSFRPGGPAFRSRPTGTTWQSVRRAPGIALPAYNYFNFGAGFAIVGGARFNVDLLNAFQSKGLEEGNPRVATPGASPLFLARPLLPRRLQASIAYDFGGGQLPQEPR